jgi:hypothetical protein
MTHPLILTLCAMLGIMLVQQAANATPGESFDMAPFARVVSSNPDLVEGMASSRIDEVPADKIFLEADLTADTRGVYTLPAGKDGRACIGLVWIEKRSLQSLELEFVKAAQAEALARDARLEQWDGPTLWQGKWVPLQGMLKAVRGRWLFDVSSQQYPAGTVNTRKVRWIFPASPQAVRVKRPVACTPCGRESVELLLQLEQPKPGERAQVEIYNGNLLKPKGKAGTAIEWDLAGPLHVQVERAMPTELNKNAKLDGTSLRLRLPGAAFSVALNDITTSMPVYIPSAGLFVAREPVTTPLEEWRRQLAGRETILEAVRARPDQSLQQAFEHVYRPRQDLGATMLSLAADNSKFVVQRNGAIEVAPFSFTQDHNHQSLTSRQDFGVLGIDVAAHEPDQKPVKLRIKDQTFAKGLGHHANGMISCPLRGGYEVFAAAIGVQWWGGGNAGSVQFSVLADGREIYKSPVMRESDAALSISLPVAGVQELLLKANDGGDGVSFDSADWAEARLLGKAWAPVRYLGDMLAPDVPVRRELAEGWLPAQLIAHDYKDIHYTQRTFVAPLDRTTSGTQWPWLSHKPLCVSEFTMKAGDAAGEVLQTFGFKQDAEQGQWARVRKVPEGFCVENNAGRLLAFVAAAGLPDSVRLTATDGMLAISGKLAAGQSAGVTAYLPGWELQGREYGQLMKAPTALYSVFRQYWTDLMAEATQIEIPDPLLSNIIRASQVHCLIAARNAADGAQIAPWIASQHYGPLDSEANSIIRGMMLLGHEEFARRCFDYYIAQYNAQGYLAMGYTMIATGWHLQTLGEYFQLTQNRAWLEKNAAKLAKVDQWIITQRHKTMRPEAEGVRPPEYGLVPPGLMADWTNFAYYFCQNGFFCAGLSNSAQALQAINYPGAAQLLQEAAAYRADILAAYAWAQARTPVRPLRNGTWVPGTPASVYTPGQIGDYFVGEDSNRSWCYDVELGAHHLIPQGILPAKSAQAASIMNIHEDNDFLEAAWCGGFTREQNHQDWFNLGGFSKVQPYYTRNGEIYAQDDDIKPFLRSYFNTIPSLINRENLSFWEHLNGSAAWNKTHETGYFLHQTRVMLVQERGNELWLAPLVPSDWLKDGQQVAVRQAPTNFGAVSYRITSHVATGAIEAEIDPPTRQQPERIVLRLRHPEGKAIKAVLLNGKVWKDFDAAAGMIRMIPSGEKLRLQVSY